MSTPEPLHPQIPAAGTRTYEVEVRDHMPVLPPRFHQRDRWAMPLMVAVYVLLIVTPFFFNFLEANLPQPWNSLFWISMIQYIPVAILALVLYGKEIAASFAYFKTYWWIKVPLLLATPFMIAFINGVVSSLTVSVTEASNEQKLQQALTQGPLILSIMVFALLGPMVEEVIFRHLLVGKLANFVPVWLVAFISIVAFAALHISTPMEIFAYLPMALVFTLLYVFGKRQVSFSLVAHWINNLLVVAILPLLFELFAATQGG